MDVRSGSFSLIVSSNSHNSQSDNQLDMILYVKEKFNLSRETYHELSMFYRNLPCSCKLQKRIQELNKRWDIAPCPANLGVQQSLKATLIVRILCLISTQKINPTDTVIEVKLIGDGTNLGRNVHVVNFTFPLLQEGAITQSPVGNHTTAILKCRESYSELFTGLADIRKDLCNLNPLFVDGYIFAITFQLGGDWKFLAMICGIDAANPHYSCIWCKFPSNERHNMVHS